MIIPVVFSLAPVNDNILLGWVFYKGIDIVKPYGWPVFAQKQYYNINERTTQELRSDLVRRIYDYDVCQPEDKHRFVPEVFPQEVIDEYIARFPSQTDAYYASMSSAWPEMTDFMVERVRANEMRLGEKAEAFLCHSDAPFIREAANKLGIKIIHYEWGPFRGSTYRNTAYLDFVGSICDGEMSARYQAFQAVLNEVPILTRREILAVFLNDENLHYASDEDPEPEFAGGLAFSSSVTLGPTVQNQVSLLEMLTRVRSVLGSDSLQVRYHPNDPLQARIPGVQERPGNLIEFIQSSRRLFTNCSNVDYEAMLFNRPVYDFGNSQYGLFANHDLTGLPDRIASEEFLSFIAFGYLVPFEMLKSIDYLRWRLSNPGEAEIYRYHLSYYLNCLQVPEEVLDMSPQERFMAILKYRGAALEENVPLQDTPIWMKKDEISRLNISLNRLERRYEHLSKEKVSLEQQRTSLMEENELLRRELNTEKVSLEQQYKENAGLMEENVWLRKELDKEKANLEQKWTGLMEENVWLRKELDKERVNLEQQRAGLMVEIERLKGQTAGLQAYSEQWQTLYRGMEEELNALLNSRSYRFTRPIRDIFAAVRKLLTGRADG